MFSVFTGAGGLASQLGSRGGGWDESLKCWGSSSFTTQLPIRFLKTSQLTMFPSQGGAVISAPAASPKSTHGLLTCPV